MSIIEPGWIKRWRQRRLEGRWRADTQATVCWAVEVLAVTHRVTEEISAAGESAALRADRELIAHAMG